MKLMFNQFYGYVHGATKESLLVIYRERYLKPPEFAPSKKHKSRRKFDTKATVEAAKQKKTVKSLKHLMRRSMRERNNTYLSAFCGK